MAIYREPAILPAGVYDVEIKAAKQSKSTSGNDMIVVTVETRFENRIHYIRDYLVFTSGADWKFVSFIIATGKKLADGEEFQPSDYVGCTARVLVKIEQYEGRPQNKIKKWLPADPTPRRETKTEEVHSDGGTSS